MIITKGKILRKYRRKAKLTQKDLAEAVKVPRGTIAACEFKNRTIDRETARKYDDFFKVKKTLIQKFLDWF